MRILFVFNHPAPYKVRLFNELSKNVDLDVIFERKSASDRPETFYNCKTYNFNVMFLKKGSFGTENSFSYELKNYIKENYKKYDLIIMNGYSTISEIIAIRYMRKHKINFVLYINGGVVRKESKFKANFKSKLINSAYKFISPCEEADECLLHYGINKNDIYHYPYSTFHADDAIKSPLTNEEKTEIRKRFELPDGKLFVTASQFIERKNNIQLFSIFQKIKDANLVVYGDGPLKESYIKYIRDNNIKNIIIKGFLSKDELFTALRGCDCFVTLSKEDIYGHTTNEAFANGLPVISSNKVVSSRHLIQNGINGYLVSLENEDEIINAFNFVTPEMGHNAIKTVLANTIEKTVHVHLDIFKEILKCK